MTSQTHQQEVPELVERLRGLLAKATTLPWQAQQPDTVDVFVPIIGVRLDDQGQPMETPTNGLVGGAMLYPTEIDAEDYERAEANAALMVGAVNALPTLLAALEHQSPSPGGEEGAVARGEVSNQFATDAAAMPGLPSREAVAQASAWLRECSTWLLTNDLDMQCPMEADPLDIADALDGITSQDDRFADADKPIASTPSHRGETGEVERLREALGKCADKFDFYEQCHRLKCTADGDEKADRNHEMAEMCRAALKTSPGDGGLS